MKFKYTLTGEIMNMNHTLIAIVAISLLGAQAQAMEQEQQKGGGLPVLAVQMA
jgi:hypothetical protein